MQLNINLEPVIIRGLLSSDELSQIYESIGSILGAKNITDYQSLMCLMEQLAAKDFSGYLLKIKACSRSIYIINILSIDKIKTLAQQFSILQPVEFSSPVLHVSSSILQPSSEGVSPHQDWPSTLGSLNSVIIWICLGGATPEGGGMTFYLSDNGPQILKGIVEENVVGLDLAQLERLKERYVYVNPGDAIAFGHFLPHSSRNQNTRLSVSFRIEDASDESWLARKYEYAQKLQIERKVFTENEAKQINDQLKKS